MKKKPKRPFGLPRIVSRDKWLATRNKLLAKEKKLTRALDALAAERRQLPMTRLAKDYIFDGPAGRVCLHDLFDGRRQLVVYHFMWHGTSDYCSGCSSFVDNIGHLAHVHARNTSVALVSDGPLIEIAPFKKRMGWTVPWFAAHGTGFNADCGATDGNFGLSVFLRADDGVFQTYFTTARGVDRLRFDFNILDLTPLGRQETWEGFTLRLAPNPAVSVVAAAR